MRYCKRGYFCRGEISRKCWQDFTWGLFSRYFSYFLHKGMCILFSRGGNFCKEDKSANNAKIMPTRKFPRLQYNKLKCHCAFLWVCVCVCLSGSHCNFTIKATTSNIDIPETHYLLFSMYTWSKVFMDWHIYSLYPKWPPDLYYTVFVIFVNKNVSNLRLFHFVKHADTHNEIADNCEQNRFSEQTT